MKIVDLTNKVFYNLTVLRLTGSSRGGSKLWECECICGNKIQVSTRHLNRKNNNVKSCGCLQRISGSQHRDWKGFEGISGSWWAARITRTDHKRVPVEISITKEYAWNLFLEQNKKCALSGLNLILSTKTNGTASLDRIDSSKGYIYGNVQWVHKHVNYMKNKFSQEYFIEMCKLITNKNNNFPIK
jgi:hypothetical protein